MVINAGRCSVIIYRILLEPEPNTTGNIWNSLSQYVRIIPKCHSAVLDKNLDSLQMYQLIFVTQAKQLSSNEQRIIDSTAIQNSFLNGSERSQSQLVLMSLFRHSYIPRESQSGILLLFLDNSNAKQFHG